MLDTTDPSLSIRKQAKLLHLCRSSLYYKPLVSDEGEMANLIRDLYLASDGRYGYRKIAGALHQQGHGISHKKVLKIMRRMGIQGIYPRKFKATTVKDSHKIYPYLLEGLTIAYPHHVWATDITYVALPQRFMYFITRMMD